MTKAGHISVLEFSKREQQYFDQFPVIFVKILSSRFANPIFIATAIKIGHFQMLITVDWTVCLKKQLIVKKLKILQNIFICKTLLDEQLE
jgi:hypothetical protein